jgi:hypothetical protein
MPIRFRCAYCNQLLGIARRKSGTVVRCPTCAGQVVVPEGDIDRPVSAPAAPLVFEQSNFEELFNPLAPRPARREKVLSASSLPEIQVPDARPAPVARPSPPEGIDVVALADPAEPPIAPAVRGILLSHFHATLLTVVVVVALAVAFGAGVLVGMALRPAS